MAGILRNLGTTGIERCGIDSGAKAPLGAMFIATSPSFYASSVRSGMRIRGVTQLRRRTEHAASDGAWHTFSCLCAINMAVLWTFSSAS
jgi:hypothetical protein